MIFKQEMMNWVRSIEIVLAVSLFSNCMNPYKLMINMQHIKRPFQLEVHKLKCWVILWVSTMTLIQLTILADTRLKWVLKELFKPQVMTVGCKLLSLCTQVDSDLCQSQLIELMPQPIIQNLDNFHNYKVLEPTLIAQREPMKAWSSKEVLTKKDLH